MSEQQVEQRDIGYVKFLVIFMGLVALFDQYLALIEGPLMPYILREYGLSKTPETFAFWQGIFGIITFSVFFIAWYSDAFGRKKGILLLMLVMGVPCLFILFVYNFWGFMILYSIVITGTLSNLWEIPISEESPAEKRGIYGSLAFLIGLIPIYAILGPQLAANLGWRWGYGIMFFMMCGLIVIWYLKMEETQRWTAEHENREKKMLKIKAALKSLDKKDIQYIIICSIVYGLWSIAFKLVGTWAAVYYVNILNWTNEEYSSILLMGGLLLMVGALLSGICMEKLGRNATLVISCAGSVIGFIGLGLSQGALIFFLMIFCFMPMNLGWIMIYFAEIFPTKIRSTAVGISSTAARASYVLGPLIAAGLLILYPRMEGMWIWGGIFMIIPLATLLIKPYETKGKELETVQEER